MGLLDKKDWVAQDFFNEYLKLKTEIPELILNQSYFKRHNKLKEVEDYQVEINEKAERLRFILNQLNVVHGIALDDLIMLSVGIDV